MAYTTNSFGKDVSTAMFDQAGDWRQGEEPAILRRCETAALLSGREDFLQGTTPSRIFDHVKFTKKESVFKAVMIC